MAIAHLAASIALEAVAVGGQGGGKTTSVDDDGVCAQHAGTAREAVERAVVEFGVRGEQGGLSGGERGFEDGQRGEFRRALEERRDG